MAKKKYIDIINHIIKHKGSKSYVLPFGASVYIYKDMSIVIDDDCMAQHAEKDIVKYLILRPNGKLYSRWDTPGSLIF